jgi:flagellar biosynthesis/type III secretory pathway ATPase
MDTVQVAERTARNILGITHEEWARIAASSDQCALDELRGARLALVHASEFGDDGVTLLRWLSDSLLEYRHWYLMSLVEEYAS